MDQCTELPLQLVSAVWNKEQHYTLPLEFQPGLQAATKQTQNLHYRCILYEE